MIMAINEKSKLDMKENTIHSIARMLPLFLLDCFENKISALELYKYIAFNSDDVTYVEVVQQRPTLQETATHRFACSTSAAHHESATYPQRSGNSY